MNYKNIYQKLIEKAQIRLKPDCYTEIHHIIPKSLGGSNKCENLVALTAREHFVAHLLLAKIHGGKLAQAAYFMMFNPKGRKYTNRHYSWLKEANSKHLQETMSCENNPMFGRIGENSPRYGKNPYENFTENDMKIFKEKMSKLTSGENNPRYGKSPFEYFTEEELEQYKNDLSIKMTGDNNPMFGKPCYYKMSNEQKKEWKSKISNTTKGKPKSEETKMKMRKPKKPQKQVTCPNCEKSGGLNNMTRYHFTNCNQKENNGNNNRNT